MSVSAIHRKLATGLLIAFFAVSFTSLAATKSGTAAEAQLRWDLKAGDKLAYDSEQDVTINVMGTPGGDFEMRTQQHLNLIWEVIEVNEQGEARIRQKLDRVRLKMTGPGQGVAGGEGAKPETLEYDSAAKDPPAGGAAMAASLFEPMMKEPLEFTLTPRGEVKNVEVPESVMAMFKNNPAAAQMGNLGTAEGIQKMLMQDIVVLPEKAPQVGETWSSKSEMTIPVVGKQTLETTYTYQGVKDVDGNPNAVIDMKRTVQYEEPENQQIQVNVAEQTSSGQTFFNVSEGRLNSAELDQSIVIEASTAGQTLKQKLTQKSKVAVRPLDESAAGKANQASQ